MLTAGFGQTRLPSAAGMPLAGYAARVGVCEGTHDDLYSRALVLDNGLCALALVSLDLLAVSDPFVRRVRQAIARQTALAPEAVLISSTHTHAAPVTVSTFFNPDETLDQRYMDRLAEAIEESVRHAWESRRPARAGVGFGQVDDVGVNRRSADRRPIDPQVAILRVDDAAGRPLACVVNYACHPTVLGPDNVLASADFPGATIARLEEALPGVQAMFVNGAQGDISVGHSSELSAIGVVTPGRTFARAEELGVRLAEAALAAWSNVSTAPDLDLRASTSTLALDWKPLPSHGEAARLLSEADARLARLLEDGAAAEDVARARSERLYASITRFYASEAEAAQGRPLAIELQAFRIGDTLLAAVPAEVFVDVGLRLKAAARHPTIFAGVTNGYIAYLPTRAAYAIGGYEVVSAKCADDSAERLIARLLELESQLFSDALRDSLTASSRSD